MESIAKGKIVKVRFQRHFVEQKLWVFIGKVVECTNDWFVLEGKAIISLKGQIKSADIDEDIRTIMVPRENIAHIRILPDTFNFETMEIITKGMRQYLKVSGGPDTSIGDI